MEMTAMGNGKGKILLTAPITIGVRYGQRSPGADGGRGETAHTRIYSEGARDKARFDNKADLDIKP